MSDDAASYSVTSCDVPLLTKVHRRRGIPQHLSALHPAMLLCKASHVNINKCRCLGSCQSLGLFFVGLELRARIALPRKAGHPHRSPLPCSHTMPVYCQFHLWVHESFRHAAPAMILARKIMFTTHQCLQNPQISASAMAHCYILCSSQEEVVVI